MDPLSNVKDQIENDLVWGYSGVGMRGWMHGAGLSTSQDLKWQFPGDLARSHVHTMEALDSRIRGVALSSGNRVLGNGMAGFRLGLVLEEQEVFCCPTSGCKKINE
jgi:hypothetical protein